jgi:hypothetical protein
MAIYRKRTDHHATRLGIFSLALFSLTACATAQPRPSPAHSEAWPAEDSIRFQTYDARFAFGPGGLVDVSAAELGDALRKLLEKMDRSLQRVPAGIGPYALDEIQMSLTVDAKGGVIVSVGATAGIILTLKRSAGGASAPARSR